MPDPEQLMTFEQLRKACSTAPKGVPRLVAEAIWRRDLVQKIGHQSYPSWFEAALKHHGVRLHRELYLKEDPSKPPIFSPQPHPSDRQDWVLTRRLDLDSRDWRKQLLKKQLAKQKEAK